MISYCLFTAQAIQTELIFIRQKYERMVVLRNGGPQYANSLPWKRDEYWIYYQNK